MNNTTCTPPAKNGEPLRVAPSGKPGPGVCATLKLSNLDLNGRLVKKGVTVSFHGLRYQVVKVRTGWLVGRFVSFGLVSGVPYTRDDLLKCEQVQVVA